MFREVDMMKQSRSHVYTPYQVSTLNCEDNLNKLQRVLYDFSDTVFCQHLHPVPSERKGGGGQ